MNTLYFGDNLDILREHLPDQSVDLIYLDPPFNSNRNYNVYLSTARGQQSDAQITALDDTWHWGEQAGRKPSYRDFTLGSGSFKKARAEKKIGEQPSLFGE